MQSKLLFLDFDGVLHPGLAGTFCYIDRFQDFLRTFPVVQVVLSTSWRLHEPTDQLLGIFAPDLQDRVIGMTPDLPGDNRYAEILQWLADNNATHARWAALDDDKSLFPPGCRNLVLCDSARGLRASHLSALVEMLALDQA